jgi:hypothetical protein
MMVRLRRGSVKKDRQPNEGADARGVIEGAVAGEGGDDAGQKAEDEGEADRQQGQLDRDREPLGDEGDHRLAGAPRGSQVPLQELAEPARVLDVPGLVEAEEALELLDHALADDGVGPDHLLDDGPGDQPQHEEDQDREPEQAQAHGVEPDDEIAAQGRPKLCRARPPRSRRAAWSGAA